MNENGLEETMSKTQIVGVALAACVGAIAGGWIVSGGEATPPTTTVAAVVTTTTAAPTTTTTVPETTTTTEAAASGHWTIEQVIQATRDFSVATYPTSLVWTDVANDETFQVLADSICEAYKAIGDKEQTLGVTATTFFQNLPSFQTQEDFAMYYFFGGGVIDLYCGGVGA